VRIGVSIILAVGLCGCDINGNDQLYPGASVFEAPDKGFHFHYLSPPWRFQNKEAKHLAFLVVDSYSQFHRSGEVTISHKLWIAHESAADPKAFVQSLHDKAVKEKKTISRSVKQFTTLTGEKFWDYVAHASDKKGGNYHYRDAAFTDANGKVVSFIMLAAYELATQDIDDLLESFSAGPDDGTETPPRTPDRGASAQKDLGPDLLKLDGGGP
jgi:hypothetical protein